jgi:hypothetical protein
MYRLAEEIASHCQQQGVPNLSSFFDYTDLQHNMAEDEDDEEPVPDPETGWAYGIDDMNWFAAASGLETLQTLAEHLEGGATIPKLPAGRRDELLEELQDCIRQLRPAAKHGREFHLAVIM